MYARDFHSFIVGAVGIVCRFSRVKTLAKNLFRVSALSAGDVAVVPSSLFRELMLSLDLILDFA